MIPKRLEDKRDELARAYVDKILYREGFNACAEILLPEIELLRKSMEQCFPDGKLEDFWGARDLFEALARWKERFRK